MGKHDRFQPRPVYTGTFKSTPLMHYLINQILDDERISYGEMSKRFEKRFARLHNCRYAILSNSGTSALQVALQTLKEAHGWPDGCRAIVPATTFVATANIVFHCKMTPIFVDVDERTFNMDMNEVAKIVERDSDIRAIIPVHLLGQPADMTALSLILQDYPKIKVIEDSCESMFVKHRGRLVGSMGDIGCFSTYVAHMIVTGVGGISTTNDPVYAAKMRSLVNHGLDISNLNVDDNFSPQPMINRRFVFDARGHSYRITEFEAAVGLAQLSTYQDMLRARTRNAQHLTAGLEMVNKYYGNPFQVPYVADETEHCWMMYPIVLNKTDDGKNVDKRPLMKWLNDHQIETRDLLPLIDQPIYEYVSGMSSFPVSRRLIESAFYIGCHQDLTPEDINYVNQTLEEYFSHEKND